MEFVRELLLRRAAAQVARILPFGGKIRAGTGEAYLPGFLREWSLYVSKRVRLKFPHMQLITLPRVAWFLNGSQEVSEWEGTLGF